MSLCSITTIFSFFLRVILDYISPIIDFWDTILSVVIILTLVFGTWLAVTQQIVKRMLAASSIVHTGYLLLAFIALSYKDGVLVVDKNKMLGEVEKAGSAMVAEVGRIEGGASQQTIQDI